MPAYSSLALINRLRVGIAIFLQTHEQSAKQNLWQLATHQDFQASQLYDNLVSSVLRKPPSYNRLSIARSAEASRTRENSLVLTLRAV